MKDVQLITTFTEYNLDWKLFIKDERVLLKKILLKSGPLQLSGEPFINLAYGYGLHNIRIVVNNEEYHPRDPVDFFSNSLEPAFDEIPEVQTLTKAYKILKNGYVFSDFTPDDFYRSHKAKIFIEDIKTTLAASRLLGSWTKSITTDYISYVHDQQREDTVYMYIKDTIYEQLPNNFTLQDLLKVCEPEPKNDQLWYIIAKARAEHKSIRIRLENFKEYTEKITPYGIILPKIEEMEWYR